MLDDKEPGMLESLRHCERDIQDANTAENFRIVSSCFLCRQDLLDAMEALGVSEERISQCLHVDISVVHRWCSRRMSLEEKVPLTYGDLDYVAMANATPVGELKCL